MGIGITLHLRGKLLVRERIELLNTNDRDIVVAALTPGRQHIVINLARTGDDARHVLGLQSVDFGQHGVEPAFGEILQRRCRLFFTQQRLGRKHNQRLPERPQHLAAQQVKNLRGIGRHANLHVVLRAQLQVAFNAR